MEWVEVSIKDRLATVIMSRLDKRNALNPVMVEALFSTFQRLNQREDVKVILLKSASSAFSAGADLAYLKELRDFTLEENIADSQRLKNLFQEIYLSPKITCSMVEGPALAGGCGLATLVDFCFATEEASFGYTEAKIGFVPALVMVYLKNKMSEVKQSEWLLTGEVFSSKKALEDGLIFRVVSQENIEQEVLTFSQKMIQGVSSQSIERIKAMQRNLPHSLPDALEFAAINNAEARRSKDCTRGIDAFLNKEKLIW